MAVPAAVLGAEAGGLVDIRRGQHEIDTFRVRWQLAATDGAGHDPLYTCIAERRTLRVAVVACGTRVVDDVDHRRAVAVGVSRIDVEIRRSPDAAGEMSEDGGRIVAGPVAVPDEIDVGRAEERSAVVEDAAATDGLRARSDLAWRRSLAPPLASGYELFIRTGSENACSVRG